MSTARLPLVLILILVFSTGCMVHRMDIRQGNFLTSEDIGQLSVGMTREQVRFLLGTPMIADSQHPDRWDYLYYLNSRYVENERTLVTVWFEAERVARIENR